MSDTTTTETTVIGTTDNNPDSAHLDAINNGLISQLFTITNVAETNFELRPLVGIGVGAAEYTRRLFEPMLILRGDRDSAVNIIKYLRGEILDTTEAPYQANARVSNWFLWDVNALREGRAERLDSLSFGSKGTTTVPGNLSGSLQLPVTTSMSVAQGADGELQYGYGGTFVNPSLTMAGHLSIRAKVGLDGGPEATGLLQVGSSFNMNTIGIKLLNFIKFGGPWGTAFGKSFQEALELVTAKVGAGWLRIGFQFEVAISTDGKPILTLEQQAFLDKFNVFLDAAEAIMDELPENPWGGGFTPDFYEGYDVLDFIQDGLQSYLGLSGIEELLDIQSKKAALAQQIIDSLGLAENNFATEYVRGHGTVTRSETGETIWFDANSGAQVVTSNGTIWVEWPDGLLYVRLINATTIVYNRKTGEVIVTPEGIVDVNMYDKFLNWINGDPANTPPPLDFSLKSMGIEPTLVASADPDLIPELNLVDRVLVVMPDGLPAYVTMEDGEAVRVYTATGEVLDLPNAEKRAELAHQLSNFGADDVVLEQILQYSAVKFALWNTAQSLQRGVDTWETQYKPLADSLVNDILYSRHGIVQQFPEVLELIEAYRAGEGAFRFIGGLAYLYTEDTPGGTVTDEFIKNLTTDQINRTVVGLMDALNYDLALTGSEALETARGKAYAALNAFQLIRKAQDTFSSDGSALDRLGSATDAVAALGALSALGLVDRGFAQSMALGVTGSATFIAIQEGLKKDADTDEYVEAVGAAVAMVGALGKVGVIDEDIADVVVGTYAAYQTVTSGMDLYENWGKNTTLQNFDLVGVFLGALNVFGQIGWLSQDDMANVQILNETYHVFKTGYVLDGDFSGLNVANFSLAVAALVVDDEDLEAQALISLVSLGVNIASGNPAGIVLSFLNFISILGNSAAQREAEREQKRIQITNIAEDVDVNGDNVSIDDVVYEYHINDDFIYLLGNSEIAVSQSTWSTFVIGAPINSTPEYFLRINHEVEAPVMGEYANADPRVIYNYSALKNSPQGLRDALIDNHKTIDMWYQVTQDVYDAFIAEYGYEGGVISTESDPVLFEYLDQLMPIDDVRIAYIQKDEGLGLTLFKNMNDDNRDGVLGDVENAPADFVGDNLDKVTTFASIGGQTGGDDSTLIQLLNDKGETYLAYALSKEATAGGKSAARWTGTVTPDDFDVLPNGEVHFNYSATMSHLSVIDLYATLTDNLNSGTTSIWFTSLYENLITTYAGNTLTVYDASTAKVGTIVDPFSGLASADLMRQAQRAETGIAYFISPYNSDIIKLREVFAQLAAIHDNNTPEVSIDQLANSVLMAQINPIEFGLAVTNEVIVNYAELSAAVNVGPAYATEADKAVLVNMYASLLNYDAAGLPVETWYKSETGNLAIVYNGDDLRVLRSDGKVVAELNNPFENFGSVSDLSKTLAQLQNEGFTPAEIQALTVQKNIIRAILDDLADIVTINSPVTEAVEAPEEVDLVASSKFTDAGMAIDPFDPIDITTFAMNSADEVMFNTNDSLTILNMYSDVADVVGQGGTPWFTSADGLTITIFETVNIDGVDYPAMKMVTYNENMAVLRESDSPFLGWPAPAQLTLWLSPGSGGYDMAYDILSQGLETFQDHNTFHNSFENPDFTLIGLNIAGLNPGTIRTGGVEVFGMKDYDKAPMDSNEILTYISWLAGKVAVDQFFALDLLGTLPASLEAADIAEFAAKAARVYVSNNTPMEEFWANNEMPADIGFDAMAYLTANPDLIAILGNDPDITFDTAALMARLALGELIQPDSATNVKGDIPDLLVLLQKAAVQYIFEGRFDGRPLAAYEADLNGDSVMDMVRVTADGLVVATITNGDAEDLYAVDIVMQNGKLLGMRKDIDGNGVADLITAPDVDGGLWTATLSSNGHTASARTLSAAEALVLAGAGLQPGGEGERVDISGDGILDGARILANGTAEITLGVVDATAPEGYVLSIAPEDIFVGETLQDAIAKVNILQLMSWVGANDSLILAVGDNIQAAQIAFAQTGGQGEYLNLGEFTLENEALINSYNGDMSLALSQHIVTRRVELYTEQSLAVAQDIATTEALAAAIGVISGGYELPYILAGETASPAADMDGIFLDLTAYLAMKAPLMETRHPLVVELETAFVALMPNLDGTLTKENEWNLLNEFVNGPLARIVPLLNAEITAMGDQKAKLDSFAAGELNFSYDSTLDIATRITDVSGGLGDILAAANGPTPNTALEDVPASIELEQALRGSLGYEVGTAAADVFNGDLTGQNSYSGLFGDDVITGAGYRDELLGGTGNDSISGLGGNDLLFGESGNDLLFGGDGDDILAGGAGDDQLTGGNGNDILIGDANVDTLTGNAGGDKFVFSSGDGQAVITDFNSAQGDKLVLAIDGVNDFASIMSVAHQVGNDVVFELGLNEEFFQYGIPTKLTLQNIQLSSLMAEDFEFGDVAVQTAIQGLINYNRAPVVNITQNFVSPEDTEFNFTIASDAFMDPDKDVIALTAILADNTALPEWLVFNGETLTFSGKPPLDFNGTVDVKIVAFDGQLASSDTFSLVITPVADPAAAVEDTGYSVEVGKSLTISPAELLANDRAGDTGGISFVSVQNALNGAVSLDVDGNIVFYGEPSFRGKTTFDYTIVDVNGVTSTSTVTVQVNWASPTDGSDLLFGTHNSSVIVAGLGDDIVHGFDENDTFSGGAGSDQLWGGGGDDILDGGAATDYLHGELGDDSLWGGDGNDALFGGDGNDDLYGEAGDDFWIGGGDGDDELYGEAGDDVLHGELGNDQLFGGDGNDQLFGGDGNDQLLGEAGDDVSYGEGGNDILYGDGGNDVLDGGDGDDIVFGHDGNDSVSGGAGNDNLAGGAGINSLDGGAGEDRAIYVGVRSDFLVARGSVLNTYTITEIANPGNVDTLVNVETVLFNDGINLDSYAIGALVNSAPVAGNDTGLLTQTGVPLLITAASLLANDSDPDGDLLTIIAVSSAIGGTVVLNGIGDVMFTPAAGYEGLASFEYDVDDGNGGSSSANVNVQVVTSASSAPTAGDDVLVGSELDDTINALSGNDQVWGLAGNDRLYGGNGDDALFGGDGDDYFYDISGANIVDGGAGNDLMAFGLARFYYDTVRNDDGSITVSRGSFSATLSDVETVTFGGVSYSFDELVPTMIDGVLTGSGVDDFITGGDVDDVIDGAGGKDTLRGGNGHDTLSGGAGIDYLYGDAGNDTLSGGADNDRLYGGNGDDTLLGGDGDDYFNDIAGANIIDGGAGNDLMVFNFARVYYDTVRNDDGSITVSRGSFSATLMSNVETTTFGGVSYSFDELAPTMIGGVLTGSGVDDFITGGDVDDVIDGAGGKDTLRGGNGNDTLSGGTGIDYLYGDAGNDTLSGGADNDRLYGGDGDDTLLGGDGDDYFNDIAGANIIDGGAGNDLIAFSLPRSYYDTVRNDDGSITVSRGDFSATLSNVETANFGSVSYSFDELVPTMIGGVLTGSGVDDFITGSDTDDVIDGAGGKDTLRGGNGNDTLLGGAGVDSLYGDAGNDTLIGGADNDRLYGGDGADTFVYVDGFGDDTIFGFSAGAGIGDVLDVSGLSSVNSFNDVLAVAYQNGANTMIDLDAQGSISLTNINLSLLHEDDFKFV